MTQLFPKGISQSLAISSQEFSLFDLYSMPHTKYLGLFFKSISTMHWLSSGCKFLSLLLHRTVWPPCLYQNLYTQPITVLSKGGLPQVPRSSSVQSLSRVRFFANPCMPGLPIHHQLPEFTQTHVHWVGDAIQPSHLCRPLLLLPSIFPSIRVFSNESALHIRWPKYWSFSFNISLSNEHPGLIFFRMDWLDLLAAQGALKSLLQFHSSKASILLHSAFFMIQHSHPYMTTGKTVALTRQTFVDKVMSLLFNMLSRLVITFPPKRKHLLISWVQSPSAVILEPPKIKSATVSTVSPSICHEVMGLDAMILVFYPKN